MSGLVVSRMRRDASATAAVPGTSTPAMTSAMAACCRPDASGAAVIRPRTTRIRTAWYQWAVSRRVAFLVYDGVTLLTSRARRGVHGGEPVRCRLPHRAAVADGRGRHVEPRVQGHRRRCRLPSPLPTRTWCPARTAIRAHQCPGSWRRRRGCRPPRRRIASICTGAFVLAAAGLLDGKRATTHWRVTHELAARCPTCRVQPDAIDVRDGDTYTSAGVTAGIDLALALVEKVRFDMSRALLDQGHTATDAAALAGFPSYESMRRVFARELSISPAAYQRRFRTARLPTAG